LPGRLERFHVIRAVFAADALSRRISYAIYLAHFPLFIVADSLVRHRGCMHATTVAAALCAAAASIVCAALLYHWIEVPCRNWMLTRRRAPLLAGAGQLTRRV
jgi:peptidoglycan/LPS O-acetylase OafA/YrhL